MLSPSVLDWLDSHIHLISWPVVCGLLWKARGLLDAYLKKQESAVTALSSAVTIVADIKKKVDEVQSNHLSHIEASINDLVIKQDKSNDILHDISGGIQVLVDRRN